MGAFTSIIISIDIITLNPSPNGPRFFHVKVNNYNEDIRYIKMPNKAIRFHSCIETWIFIINDKDIHGVTKIFQVI